MKKLYRRGTVHPSPPIISDHLSFLPAAILTMAAALSPEDREVLAYLISCSNSSVTLSSGLRRTTHKAGYGKGGFTAESSRSTSTGGAADHPPQFNCDCFRCYMSYWVRWDSSQNRQLIHEIIDAFEDGLIENNKSVKNSRKQRRKRGGCDNGSVELKKTELTISEQNELGESESVQEGTSSSSSSNNTSGSEGGGEEETEKGSVRRFMSYIGERIWGVWGQ